MFKKVEEVQLSPQEEVYYDLLSDYRKALNSLELSDEEIENKVAQYVQLACLFQEQ